MGAAACTSGRDEQDEPEVRVLRGCSGAGARLACPVSWGLGLAPRWHVARALMLAVLRVLHRVYRQACRSWLDACGSSLGAATLPHLPRSAAAITPHTSHLTPHTSHMWPGVSCRRRHVLCMQDVSCLIHTPHACIPSLSFSGAWLLLTRNPPGGSGPLPRAKPPTDSCHVI